MNSINRKLTTVYAPRTQQGFLGKGHTARTVIQVDYSQSDPFIMLMDDMLEKTDNTPLADLILMRDLKLCRYFSRVNLAMSYME
jgi:hypothetical protein